MKDRQCLNESKTIIFSELEDCDGSYETDLKSWSAEILIIKETLSTGSNSTFLIKDVYLTSVIVVLLLSLLLMLLLLHEGQVFLP